MAVNNSLVQRQGGKTQTFSAFLTSDAIKNRINSMVGGKDGQRFISAVISAVSVNPGLTECDHATILSAALLGESLKLFYRLRNLVAAPLNMHIDRAAVGTLLYRVIYNASAIITKSLHNYPLQIFIKQLKSVAIISLEVIIYLRD